MKRDRPLAVRIFETPWGWVGLAAGAKGLVRLVLPGPRKRPDLEALAGLRGEAPAPARTLAARAEREVREYLAGRRRTFSIPADLDGLPPFQRKVLLAERRIPYGRTVTYGELAAKVGRPRAARAVGQALAHNPVPLVIPCHRVVASGGGLGGFGGGLPLKKRLLTLEAARRRPAAAGPQCIHLQEQGWRATANGGQGLGMKRRSVILLCLLAAGPAMAAPVRAEEAATGPPSWTALDSARQWLSRNPPNGTNAAERRQRMALIQKACDGLSPSDYGAYAGAWDARDDRADRMEETNPALRYLRAATLQAMADVRRTRVRRGLAVWHLYNMGYVFKTPTSCFGIDLAGRDVQRLAADLDFLLVSHEHSDHYSAPLIKAMIGRQRPVITRWFQGTTIVNQAAEYRFGDVHVRIDIGDHHREQANQQNNMLMFEVDGGAPANHAVVYHSGDGNNFEKMRPVKPVDVFIVHVQVGMPVAAAVRHLKPKMTLVSHVLELAHSPLPPQAWRWSYEYAFDVIRDLPETEATVLTWGERWLAPGTEVAPVTGE